MSAENPYQTPESQLIIAVEGRVGGSLESALAGDYQFSIRQIMDFGWSSSAGFKGTFWLGLIVYFVASGVVSQLSQWLSTSLGLVGGFGPGASIVGGIASMAISVILGATIYSFGVGVAFLAINRAADKPVKPADVFKYLPLTLPIFLTYLLMMALTVLGFLLFIVPGIYLSVGYLFAVPLMVDKKLSPWDALEASRKAIHHQWWRVFGFTVLITLLVFLSFLTLGIALIWVLPAVAVAAGKLYVIIFGIEARVTA